MTTPGADIIPFEVDLDDLTMQEIDTIEGLAEGQGIATFMNPQYPQGKIVPAMAYVCALRLGTGQTWGDLYNMKSPELFDLIARVFPKEKPRLKKPQDHKPKQRKPKATPQAEETLETPKTDELDES